MATKRQQAAVDAFNSGMNCAQATLTAFSDKIETEQNTLNAIASGFGGGMGMLQHTCGAVTGAFMFFGLYNEKNAASNNDLKDRSAKQIREFHEKFLKEKSSSNCRELIGYNLQDKEELALASEKNVFKTVCGGCVECAVGIIEEMI